MKKKFEVNYNRGFTSFINLLNHAKVVASNNIMLYFYAEIENNKLRINFGNNNKDFFCNTIINNDTTRTSITGFCIIPDDFQSELEEISNINKKSYILNKIKNGFLNIKTDIGKESYPIIIDMTKPYLFKLPKNILLVPNDFTEISIDILDNKVQENLKFNGFKMKFNITLFVKESMNIDDFLDILEEYKEEIQETQESDDKYLNEIKNVKKYLEKVKLEIEDTLKSMEQYQLDR